MAYVISDSCVSCGTCEGECPVGAISQGDSQYVIDADACISCDTLGYYGAQQIRHYPCDAFIVYLFAFGGLFE